MNANHESLLRRWGAASTSAVWIGGNDLDARREIEDIAASLKAPPNVPIDCAFITPNVAEEAAYFAKKLSPRLVSGAPVWVVWSVFDDVGLAAVSACLRDVGFDEVGRVGLSTELLTVGFRRRGCSHRKDPSSLDQA